MIEFSRCDCHFPCARIFKLGVIQLNLSRLYFSLELLEGVYSIRVSIQRAIQSVSSDTCNYSSSISGSRYWESEVLVAFVEH